MPSRSRNLAWLLAAIFALAMFMGAGPGMLLANEPATWFGFPRLYVWGLFWCLVEASVVIVAYFFVWQLPDDKQDEC